jgi:hypothetical protein
MPSIMERIKGWSPFGVGEHKERIIVFVSALVGIVAFIVLMKRQKADSASATTYGLGSDTGNAVDFAGSPNNLGSGSSGIVDSGSVAEVQPNYGITDGSLIPVYNNQVSLGYSQDTGVNLSNEISSGQGGGGSTGGFNISLPKLLGGIGFGVTGKTRAITPSQTSKQDITAQETFTTNTQLINASPDSIASVETFLERVGGTAESRMAHQKDILAMGEQSMVGIPKGVNVGVINTPVSPANATPDYKLMNKVSTVLS